MVALISPLKQCLFPRFGFHTHAVYNVGVALTVTGLSIADEGLDIESIESVFCFFNLCKLCKLTFIHKCGFNYYFMIVKLIIKGADPSI